MPEFVKGLRLGGLFNEGAARPRPERHFPALAHTAAMLGRSSEVLGYDDEESRDHNRGPRFQRFIAPEDYDEHGREVKETFARLLPREFRGYSTDFRAADDDALADARLCRTLKVLYE